MKNSQLTITGFFPFLNDWGTIGSLVLTLNSVLAEVTKDYEILIIDDGSDDKSKDVLKSISLQFGKVRLITHPKNRGYGGALKSGFANAKMDWIFYTDGDAQYDPRDLKILLEKLKRNVDIVNGYKIRRMDPWYRKVAGKTYHYFVKLLFNIPIRDTDCDFRLMRRSMFDVVKLESNSGLICAEMIKKIADFGFKFEEAPVNHYWRTSGKSQFFNFKRVFEVFKGLIKLWFKLVIKKEHLKNADQNFANS